MNISRRWFIGGMTAFGAASFSRIIHAKSGVFSADTPEVRIGMITDVHISLRRTKDGYYYEGVDVLRKTLEWFRDREVDGVAICGDIADYGLVEELEEFARIWNSVFPGGKTLTGRKVERLFVCGNHDWIGYTYNGGKKLFGEKAVEHSLSKDGFAGWSKVFDEPFESIWRKEVKGYTFVGAHWIADKCRSREEKGVPQAAPWFAASASSIDSSKPFFYLQHPLPKNTVNGSWAWGQDAGDVGAALEKMPNAIALSGHSHYSLSDERTIWQGSYTSIGLASLKYIAFGYGDVQDGGRENDRFGGSVGNRNYYKVMPNMSGRDGHHGILAHIYSDRIVYERRDFGDFSLLGDDWVMPLPAAEPMPFMLAKRISESIAPEFRSGASLAINIGKGKNRGGGKVKSVVQDVVKVKIPSADGRDGVMAFDYELIFKDSAGKSVRRFVFAEKWYRSLKIRSAVKLQETIFSLKSIGLIGKIFVEVRPRNTLGKKGSALFAEIEYMPPPTPAPSSVVMPQSPAATT